MKLSHYVIATAVMLLALVWYAALTTPAHAAPATAQYQPNDAYDTTATVAATGTTSGAVDLSGTDLVGIFVPSTFDGTTITITASTAIDGTFVAVQDGDGSTFTLTTTASRYVPVKNLALISGLRYIKLVAGSTQNTTDTVFTLALRPI